MSVDIFHVVASYSQSVFTRAWPRRVQRMDNAQTKGLSADEVNYPTNGGNACKHHAKGLQGHWFPPDGVSQKTSRNN